MHTREGPKELLRVADYAVGGGARGSARGSIPSHPRGAPAAVCVWGAPGAAQIGSAAMAQVQVQVQATSGAARRGAVRRGAAEADLRR